MIPYMTKHQITNKFQITMSACHLPAGSNVIELRRSGNPQISTTMNIMYNGRLPARTERARSGGKPFRYRLEYTEFMKKSLSQ